MHRIAIFASGEGTNAGNFINYFNKAEQSTLYYKKREIIVSLIVCNNPEAGVIRRANEAGIPILIVNRDTFYNGDMVLSELKAKADFIVLAGFLWMIPENIIKAFSGKMVNIHPALLPKYGGKGMYGAKVHEAVIANREKESGITIHYVNENYDEGQIIFQSTCPVDASDTSETLAKMVHELEYKFYPVIVEKLLLGNIS